MAFRFKLDEPIERGFRRIGVEQLEQVEVKLAAADGVGPEAVHAVRKSLKRVRALLRLVRPGLAEEAYKTENARLRDTARLLAGSRDRHVMLETLIAIEARHNLDPKATQELKRALNGSGIAAAAPTADVVRDARKSVAQGRRAFRRLKLSVDGFEPVARGLEAGLRSCRKGFHGAYANPSDEAFHEWRKTVQAHWRHMLLLSRAWPGLMIARAHQARDLSQWIGEDHDLGVLAAYVTNGDNGLEPAVGARVADLCRARQTLIRAHVKPLGERLLADGAEGLARRVAVYWTAAKDATQTGLESAAEQDAGRVPSKVPVRRGRGGKGAAK